MFGTDQKKRKINKLLANGHCTLGSIQKITCIWTEAEDESGEPLMIQSVQCCLQAEKKKKKITVIGNGSCALLSANELPGSVGL